MLTFRVHVLGDPVTGIQEVWVTHTNPPGGLWPGAGSRYRLEQDDVDLTLWTGDLTTGAEETTDFMVQAVTVWAE